MTTAAPPYGGAGTDPVQEDRFLVFVRRGRPAPGRPDRGERALASCATYAEARRLGRTLHQAGHACAIRYVGPAGGGD